MGWRRRGARRVREMAGNDAHLRSIRSGSQGTGNTLYASSSLVTIRRACTGRSSGCHPCRSESVPTGLIRRVSLHGKLTLVVRRDVACRDHLPLSGIRFIDSQFVHLLFGLRYQRTGGVFSGLHPASWRWLGGWGSPRNGSRRAKRRP
jgi:hypothetical protein